MPTYATSAPLFAERRLSPRALALIIGVHAAAIAAVMSAKMELPQKVVRTITQIEFLDPPKPPPPEPIVEPQRKPRSAESVIEQPEVIVPVPLPLTDRVDSRPVPPGPPVDIIRPPIESRPANLPRPAVVRIGPRFATPDHALKPPYPTSKQNNDEEAALRLRLAIDERGRVIGVEPVGGVDPVFFEAARRHLLARWRYKPATEDGRPVSSSTVITLRFELEG